MRKLIKFSLCPFGPPPSLPSALHMNQTPSKKETPAQS